MSYLIDCRQIFFPITDSNILFHLNDLAFHNLGLIFISKKNEHLLNPYLLLFFLRYFEIKVKKNPNDIKFDWVNYNSIYVKMLNLDYFTIYKLYLVIRDNIETNLINIQILDKCKSFKINNEKYLCSLLFLLVKKRKINTFIDLYNECRVEGYDKIINDLMYYDEKNKIFYFN